MQARYITAGDYITYNGKVYRVKSVEWKQGTLLVHTDGGGTLHFHGREEVECD